MSVITDIADAVAAEINGATLSQSVTAQRVYPHGLSYALKDLTTARVPVVPMAEERPRPEARDLVRREYQIDIGILKKLDADANPDVDPWLDLTDEIKDHFELRELGVHEAVCLSSSNDPIYDADSLREKRLFASVISLTCLVIR